MGPSYFSTPCCPPVDVSEKRSIMYRKMPSHLSASYQPHLSPCKSDQAMVRCRALHLLQSQHGRSYTFLAPKGALT